jgi:hypothetical protein
MAPGCTINVLDFFILGLVLAIVAVAIESQTLVRRRPSLSPPLFYYFCCTSLWFGNLSLLICVAFFHEGCYLRNSSLSRFGKVGDE